MKYHDEEVQKELKHLTTMFKVDPMVFLKSRRYKKEEKYFSPKISTFILEKMKKTAEAYLKEVKNAVITVPAYFNDARDKPLRTLD